AFLVATEEQRGAAMRAAVVHHADAAGAVAKRDQLFAQQHQAHRRAVALEFRGLRRRQPVAAHQVAHDRAGTDLREFPAFALGGHRESPIPTDGLSYHSAAAGACMAAMTASVPIPKFARVCRTFGSDLRNRRTPAIL